MSIKAHLSADHNGRGPMCYRIQRVENRLERGRNTSEAREDEKSAIDCSDGGRSISAGACFRPLVNRKYMVSDRLEESSDAREQVSSVPTVLLSLAQGFLMSMRKALGPDVYVHVGHLMLQ